MKKEEDKQLEERELCPDDLCTGIIGEDGRCGVCGLERGAVPHSYSTPPDRGKATLDETETEYGTGNGMEEEWEERQLCKDDLCTGIIGKDGRCGVCGKPADN